MLPYVLAARVGSENQRVSAVLKYSSGIFELPLSRQGRLLQGFPPFTYSPEPEVESAGQAMHAPLALGTRLAVGWPELVNI